MDGELSRSLKISLERLERGDSVAACLAGFPQHAAELEPMLIAAEELMVLRGRRLSAENRRQAKARLRGALAAGPGTAPAPGFLGRLLGRQAGRPAANQGVRPYRPRLAWAGVIVALLCVTLGAGAVAASRPGQAAYPLRVAAERWPVYLQTSPAARAAAWLDVADRRLGDLESSLAHEGRPDPVALAALLAGEEAGAQAVAALPADEQAAIAARMAAQADALERLAQQASNPGSTGALAAASRQASARAARLGYRPSAPSPTPAPALPATTAPSPTATRPATSTPRPTATAAPTRGPRGDKGPQATDATGTRPADGNGPGGPRAGMTAEPGPRGTPTPPTTATARATAAPAATHTPMAQGTPESRPTAGQQNGPEPGSDEPEAGGPQSSPQSGSQNGSQDPAPADDHGADTESGSSADSGSGGGSGGSRH